jgi:hypothetical protein
MNALFTPIDMTEYEDSFLGEYHTDKFMPAAGAMQYNRENAVDNHPFTADEAWLGEAEPPKFGLSNPQDEKREELPEEIEDEYPEDLDDDEDEDAEDWTNGEDTDEDYEEKEWPPHREHGDIPVQSDYFNRNETLRDRYNEKEIDAFLKLLDVKPFTNWQDKSLYHHSMGIHDYNDEAQMVDPEYHLLAEVERQHLERW